LAGDFALDWPALWGTKGDCGLFSTARDAVVAIIEGDSRTRGKWLVPDFMCPVVPATLVRYGLPVEPYPWLTPWEPDWNGLRDRLTDASGVVVPFYMGLRPDEKVWELLAGLSGRVIEDRCQCVGPAPDPEDLRGDYAIGSYRKWLPTPDGAFCVRRNGPAPRPTSEPNRMMVRLRLAAGLLKQAREDGVAPGLDMLLETAQVDLFREGELCSDPNGRTLQPAGPASHPEIELGAAGRRASRLSELLVQSADIEGIRARRLRNQSWLAAQLTDNSQVRLLEPFSGAIRKSEVPLLALPVLCRDRDAVREKLYENRVFCAVHWVDGNWSGQDGVPAQLAATVLSLPIDQRYEPEDLERIVEVLRDSS
jgi:hypothetical protein